MESTSVLSLSWRAEGPELLAQFTTPIEERPRLLTRLATELGAEEVLYLVTCNRVEVAFRGKNSLEADDARRAVIAAFLPSPQMDPRTWRAWKGEGAIEHLFLVAAGLASAKVGETEIAGQLRDSLSLSRDLGLSGGPLSGFIEEALRTARKVRQETALSEGRTSLAEIALDRLRLLRRNTKKPLRVALIGRSAMTERCARSLWKDQAEIHWANRTPGNLQPNADEVGATIHALAEFNDSPPLVDAIVTATGSTDPVITGAAAKRLAKNGAKLVIDLSVSPDIRKEDSTAAGMTHFSLREILEQADRTRAEKSEAAADARVLVDDALELLAIRHRARSAGQVASELHERFRNDAALATQDALKKDFKHLNADDSEKLKRFADLLARRLAHSPSKGLRRLAVDHGTSAAESFLDDKDRKESCR